MWLPMFPLESVFFPGETVHLHIFEDRYKELISDIGKEDGIFGVPAYMDGEIAFGAEMKLERVIKTYPKGELDIVCKAQRIFKINSFKSTMPPKKYAGGEVVFLTYNKDATSAVKKELLQLVSKLYGAMGASILIKDTGNLNLHVWVHRIGFSLVQEYLLMQMTSETERLALIKSHLQNMILVMKQVDRAKEMIGMNGHFKSFDPLDFKNFKF